MRTTEFKMKLDPQSSKVPHLKLRDLSGRWLAFRPFRIEVGNSLHRLHTRIRHLWWRCESGWHRLTAPYKLELNHPAEKTPRSWKLPFQIFSSLCLSVLNKLSPPRRLFLLLTLILAILSVIGVHFLFVTQDLEFVLAFCGLLTLLIMVLGDDVMMKRDIEIAREIQRWLVPRRPPDVAGIDVAFIMRPAKSIGGDYYDAFLRRREGPLLIAVADVCGKSVPAAMLMATLQASLRALARSQGSLSELVASEPPGMCHRSSSPPILKRGDGSVERLKSDNIPLGIELKEDY